MTGFAKHKCEEKNVLIDKYNMILVLMLSYTFYSA